MLFEVVTCGFEPARLEAHPGHADALSLPWPGDPGFLERGHALLSEHATGDRGVILVHAGTPAVRRRVAALRATLRQTLHGRPLRSAGFARPVTGLAAVASWLTALAGKGVPAGVALSHLLDRHTELLPTYVVTSTVAGVDLPIVRLNHHMLSWLPGTTFSIALDEHPRITPGRLSSPATTSGTGDGVDLVVAGTDKMAAQLAGVTPRDVVDTVRAVGPDESSDPWWGRARFFEQTIVPRTVQQSINEIEGRTASRCSQCGEPTLGVCPFCSSGEGRTS